MMALVKAGSFNHSISNNDSQSVVDLLTQLTTDSPAQRRIAATALVKHRNVSAALLQQLWRESERSVREAIFLALTDIADEIAVEGLIRCLRSEDVQLRNDAIEAMQAMPTSVGPVMHKLLHDENPDIRIFAVNILESLKHPDVEAWLIEAITEDPHINVCATAVDLLTEVGSQAAVAPLKQLLNKFPNEPFFHFAIELALKRIQGE